MISIEYQLVNKPTLDITIKIRANQLADDNTILSKDCWKNIETKYAKTINAQNRAMALMSGINAERTVDEIQRKAECYEVIIKDNEQVYKYKKEMNNANK